MSTKRERVVIEIGQRVLKRNGREKDEKKTTSVELKVGMHV